MNNNLKFNFNIMSKFNLTDLGLQFQLTLLTLSYKVSTYLLSNSLVIVYYYHNNDFTLEIKTCLSLSSYVAYQTEEDKLINRNSYE